MHVLLIHQAYAGPRDPGGTRHHELATELAARGHRVTIVASDVSYMTGDRVPEAPAGASTARLVAPGKAEAPAGLGVPTGIDAASAYAASGAGTVCARALAAGSVGAEAVATAALAAETLGARALAAGTVEAKALAAETVGAGAVAAGTVEAETVAAEALVSGGEVRVVRVPGSRRLHRSWADRAASFVGFGGRALRAALAVPDVDLVWGTSPPLPQLVPAWLASLRCCGGFVLEERDLWPEFAVGLGVLREGAATRAALRAKRFLYGRARRVIVNSPGFLPFLERYGVDARKVRVVPNGVDPRLFDPEERAAELRRAWGADGRFVVLYAGALGPANDLETALDAAAALRDTAALLVLAGDGKARPALMEQAAARGLDNVRFLGAQPKEAMPRVIAAADACLATLRDIPLFRTTYPNKVFDYMAGGRPVLLLIDGVIRDVVEEAGAGAFVRPGDAAGLAAVVRAWMTAPEAARAMGRAGRRAVCARFDRRAHAAELEALFAELVEDAPSERARPAPAERWTERESLARAAGDVR